MLFFLFCFSLFGGFDGAVVELLGTETRKKRRIYPSFPNVVFICVCVFAHVCPGVTTALLGLILMEVWGSCRGVLEEPLQ